MKGGAIVKMSFGRAEELVMRLNEQPSFPGMTNEEKWDHLVEMERLRERYRLSTWFLFGGLANLLISLIVSLLIGGDAINGKIENGHFYLFGGYVKGVKEYTEVGQALFEYSKWHAYSCIALAPFMVIAGGMRQKLKKRLASMQEKRELGDKR